MNNTTFGTNELLSDDLNHFSENYKGNAYLKDLSDLIAKKFKVDYVLIGKLEKNAENTVKSVALHAKGKQAPQMVYKLGGTPCENVAGRKMCYYPKGVQALFPTDKELEELGVESYFGSPLFDENRDPAGLIVLMHSQTIQNPAYIENLLKSIQNYTEKALLNE